MLPRNNRYASVPIWREKQQSKSPPIVDFLTFYQDLHDIPKYILPMYTCSPEAQCDVMCKVSIGNGQ